jgi:hypothetical protein
MGQLFFEISYCTMIYALTNSIFRTFHAAFVHFPTFGAELHCSMSEFGASPAKPFLDWLCG